MLILIKGAGDIATGVAHKLHNCGFNIIMTEIERPTAVRHTASFSTAVTEDNFCIDDVFARLASDINSAKDIISNGDIAVLVDPNATAIDKLHPDVVVDAIIAKRNISTNIDDASTVIALGPGFTAGVDCHCVIETMRGHDLGKLIFSGSASENTGVPGSIAGFSGERLLRAPTDGVFSPVKKIGDTVQQGDVVAYVNEEPIIAEITGVLRGILPNGISVHSGMKSGDIDPRCEIGHCFSISDKARAIGGGVLEAILSLNKSIIKRGAR